MTPNGKSEDAPEITPQVLHLRDLLKWVKQGRVRVPMFQRDFTWDRGRMLHLFDSIRNQYPIGTLLFWETKKPLPMSENIGPLQLPQTQSGTLLVLDGQQRLTTLAGVLLFGDLPRSEKDDKDPKRWDVWYDAATDDFCHLPGNGTSDAAGNAPPISAVRVSELMSTKGLYAAAGRILKSGDPALSGDWVGKIEEVSAALSAYRLPLVIFTTDSMQLAVDSFTRLNRAGQSMGPDEMLSALTYRTAGGAESFRLATHIDSIVAEISRTGFGTVDRVVVLRVVLLAADLDPFRTEWDELAKDTQTKAEAKLPTAIHEARNGLLQAIKFLEEEHILNRRLLPYSMQLVGLATFFGRRGENATEGQKLLLRRWLWVSAFTENFGESNPSRQLQQLKDLRDRIPSEENPSEVRGIDLAAPAHPFPERHDHRSARVRALLCVLLRQPTLRPDGQIVTPEEMAREVLERGHESSARIFSSSKMPLLSSPANRLFDVNKDERGQAKNWLLKLPEGSRQNVLDSHYISGAAFKALVAGEQDKFVELRIKTLMELENAFMTEKGVVPPKSDQPARSAIDVEDDVPLSESATLSE